MKSGTDKGLTNQRSHIPELSLSGRALVCSSGFSSLPRPFVVVAASNPQLYFLCRAFILVTMAASTAALVPAAIDKKPQGIDLYSRFALAGALGCSVTHGAFTPVDVYAYLPTSLLLSCTDTSAA